MTQSFASDVQGCTNIAVARMQRSVDVQGCTNIAIAGAKERVFDIAKHMFSDVPSFSSEGGVASSPNG